MTVRFDYLDAARRERFVARLLGLPNEVLPAGASLRAGDALALARLRALDRLTPGDFARLARQWRLLGPAQPTLEACVEGLERLCAEKNGGAATSRPLGFLAPV